MCLTLGDGGADFFGDRFIMVQIGHNVMFLIRDFKTQDQVFFLIIEFGSESVNDSKPYRFSHIFHRDAVFIAINADVTVRTDNALL